MKCLLLAILIMLSVLVVTPARGQAETDGDRPQGEPTQFKLYDGQPLAHWLGIIKQADLRSDAVAQTVPALIEILRDSRLPWHTRREAALTLGRIGERARHAIPGMIELLDELEDARDREWLIKALGFFGGSAQEAAPNLSGLALDDDEDPGVRLRAVEALSRLGVQKPVVLSTLISLLSAPDLRNAPSIEPEAMRVAAAQGLTFLGIDAAAAVPHLLRAANEESPMVRRHAVNALAAMGPAALPALNQIEALVLFDPSPAVRDAAAATLAAMGSEAAPTLQALLTDQEFEIRVRAASALGKSLPVHHETVPALVDALRDDHHEVAVRAAISLLQLRQAVPLARRRLLGLIDDPIRQVRRQAVETLIELALSDESTRQRLQSGDPDESRSLQYIHREIERRAAERNQ